jgi:hypothetical protein
MDPDSSQQSKISVTRRRGGRPGILDGMVVYINILAMQFRVPQPVTKSLFLYKIWQPRMKSFVVIFEI